MVMHQLKVWFYRWFASGVVEREVSSTANQSSSAQCFGVLSWMLGLAWWKTVQYYMPCRYVVIDVCWHLHQICSTLSSFRLGKLSMWLCVWIETSCRSKTMLWILLHELVGICSRNWRSLSKYIDMCWYPELFCFSVDWCNRYACIVHVGLYGSILYMLDYMVLYWIMFVWLQYIHTYDMIISTYINAIYLFGLKHYTQQLIFEMFLPCHGGYCFLNPGTILAKRCAKTAEPPGFFPTVWRVLWVLWVLVCWCSDTDTFKLLSLSSIFEIR